jgi:hypothetical protein
MVLVNCYVNFFGRRKTDTDIIVLLVNATETECSVVICRQQEILFARTIPYDINLIKSMSGAEKFISEIEACVRYFQANSKTNVIERIILLANKGTEERLIRCVLDVAKKHAVPAHIGDVLLAVANADIYKRGIDGRGLKDNWTTTFGLSLSDYRNQG